MQEDKVRQKSIFSMLVITTLGITMTHRINEEKLRKIIRQTLAESWLDDIKAGAERAVDYVQDFFSSSPESSDPSSQSIYFSPASSGTSSDMSAEEETRRIAGLSKGENASPQMSTGTGGRNPFPESPDMPNEVTEHVKLNSKIQFNSNQYAMMEIIERVMRSEGFSSPVIAAAFVNAYAESAFNPLAGGDKDDTGTPHAVGLFQLYTPGGAGEGMTHEQKIDPAMNTKRICDVAKRTPFMDEMQRTDDIPALAAQWSYHVERPKRVEYNMRMRADLAIKMFNLREGSFA